MSDSDEHKHISIDPSLPCAVFDGDHLCGKPATAATVDRLGDGTWRLFPMCRDCVRATAIAYGIDLTGGKDDGTA